MSFRPCLFCLALAAGPALAQLTAPAPAAVAPAARASAAQPSPLAASSPGTRPAPRLQGLPEALDNAAMPGQLRPENRALPQLSVPLGRDPGAGSPATAPLGTLDDRMARCKAMPPGAARQDCLDKARVTAPQR